MAEKRFIGRRITESDRIRQLANEGKLLATTLYAFFIPYLDSSGRMNANPLLLKGGMFEGYDWTVEQLEDAVTDLGRVGLVRLYQNGKFGHLIQYEKFLTADGGFNKPHDREPDSDLPGPDDAGSTPVITPERPRTPTSTAPTPSREPYGTRTGNLPEPSHTSTEHVPPDVEIERDIEIEKEPRAHAREAGALDQGNKGNRKKRRPPKLGDFDARTTALPDFVDPDRWRAFINHLEALGKTVTEESAREMLTLLAKTPTDADEMLRIAVTKGWKSVYPLDPTRSTNTANPTAAAAWDQILDAARQGKPPDNLDKPAAAALKTIGGWTAVAYCPEHHLAGRRRSFLDAYTTPAKVA